MMVGIQYKEVRDAIASAFNKQSLDYLGRVRLNRKLKLDLNFDAGMNEIAQELIQLAEEGGWEVKLVEAAYREQPDNPQVADIYEKYGLAPRGVLQRAGQVVASAPATAAPDRGFEKIVRSANPFINVGKIVEVSGQVCSINTNGSALGTGFLVGPDVVLTNYHVMEAFIAPGTADVSTVRCTFDYKSLPNGARGGRDVRLAAGAAWLIDHSPYTQAERNLTPDAALPRPDELDYALLRLAEPVGALPIEVAAGTGAPPRGWVRVPSFHPPAPEPAAPPNAFLPPMPLLILQHPGGRPLQLTVDEDAVLDFDHTGSGVNANRTRVRYATNTEGGASGSPVFDVAWNLVALHHYGDPAFSHPAYNQGIPIDTIRALLESRGKASVLA